MKKLIIIVLIVCFVPVSALASNAETMMWRFNFNAKTYGGKKIDESMITEDTENRVVFSSDGLKISFSSTGDKFNSALVVSADEAEFLPYCVCAAMCLSPSFDDNVLESFGYMLYCYLSVRSGKENEFGLFGDYRFYINKVNDNYLFVIGEK